MNEHANVNAGNGGSKASATLAEKFLVLHHAVGTILQGERGRALLFLSCGENGSGSRITRAYARTVSGELGRKVLLFDADHSRPGQAEYFGIRPVLPASEERPADPPAKGVDFCRVGDTSLYLTRVAVGSEARRLCTDVDLTRDFLGRLRERFDLVLIDAPPQGESLASLPLSRAVDGVVLVVEAGKTRWQAADRMRQEVERHGGRVLGVVLGNRDYALPDKLYRKL